MFFLGAWHPLVGMGCDHADLFFGCSAAIYQNVSYRRWYKPHKRTGRTPLPIVQPLVSLFHRRIMVLFVVPEIVLLLSKKDNRYEKLVALLMYNCGDYFPSAVLLQAYNPDSTSSIAISTVDRSR